MKLSVCIPVYNEHAVIENSIRELCRTLDEAGADYELVLCSDGSTDDSLAIMNRTAADYSDGRVRVIGYEKNRGKGCAVRTAVLESRGDIVLYTDSDLAYGTEIILPAAAALEKSGSDVLAGSRALAPGGYGAYTPIRALASKIYVRILSLFAGFSLSDSQCGFKILRGDGARKIFALCTTDGFAFDFEVLMIAKKMGMKITEYPVTILRHGESKVHLVQDSMRMLRDIRAIRRRVNALFAKK